MFDIGFSEMLLLAAIALIAIGPKQLPDVARSIGRFLNQLKSAGGDFQRSFTSVGDDSWKQVAPQLKRHVEEIVQSASTAQLSHPQPENRLHAEEPVALDEHLQLELPLDYAPDKNASGDKNKKES